MVCRRFDFLLRLRFLSRAPSFLKKEKEMHRTSCSLTYSPSETRINQEQSVKVQIYFYLSAIKFPRDTRVKLSCKLLSTLPIFLQQRRKR